MAKHDEGKEPFVGSADRPDVKLELDTPVGELRVRELAAILAQVGGKSPFEAGKTSLKDFFDKPFPEIAKDYVKELKIEKIEKPEKPEKLEKNEKFEKNEKAEKHEKQEKGEIKELKAEKIEHDGVFDGGFQIPGPDPRFESVLQAVGELTRQVATLTDQVAKLSKGK